MASRNNKSADPLLFLVLIITYPFIWLYEHIGWSGLVILGLALLFLMVWFYRYRNNAHKNTLNTHGLATKNMPTSMDIFSSRNFQIFQESAQLVAQTKNKGTARSRYELMLSLWQDGSVSGEGVPELLQQARIKTEELEAGKKVVPTKIIIASEIVDNEFIRQLDNAESAIRLGNWNEARWALRKLGYQSNSVSMELQDRLQALGRRIILEDPEYQSILLPLCAMIKAAPGQKQTSYYTHFPSSTAEEIREIIYWAAQANLLLREKKGNTYLLYLTNHSPA